jgi:hypothetical protein
MRGRLARRPLLKDLQDAVLSNYPEPQNLRARIAEQWEHEKRALEASWDQRWAELVPGGQVLNELWKTHTKRSYDKTQDGSAIAAAMDRPDELARTLEAFLQR